MVWPRQDIRLEPRRQIVFLDLVFNVLDTLGSSLHLLWLFNLQSFLLSVLTVRVQTLFFHRDTSLALFCSIHILLKEIMLKISWKVTRTLRRDWYLRLLLIGNNNHCSVSVYHLHIWVSENVFLYGLHYTSTAKSRFSISQLLFSPQLFLTIIQVLSLSAMWMSVFCIDC